MWIKTHRARQARQEQRSQRYPVNLTDTEWILIEPLLPRPGAGSEALTYGRSRDQRRKVVQVVGVLRSSCLIRETMATPIRSSLLSQPVHGSSGCFVPAPCSRPRVTELVVYEYIIP